MTTEKVARKGVWLVLDGRARFDTDAAAILEAVGAGTEDQPPRKAVRHWRGEDAVLCFCPGIDEQTCDVPEYKEEI